MEPQYHLVPGPTKVLPEISKIYSNDYPSPDLEEDFFSLYKRVQTNLGLMLGTSVDDTVVVMSGEGMLALWGALKSVIKPDDRVLSIATGIFGYGIGEMATSIGANVKTIDFQYDEIVCDHQKIQEEIVSFKPKLVTIVHCETPSGTLNPIEKIGKLVKETDSLYYVDFVASAGGVPVKVGEWGIDLGLLGSQKCLSLPPDLSVVTVSPKAWKVINEVGYVGYDALKPWRTAVDEKYFPYTHNWRALAAMEQSILLLKKEGFENCFSRHTKVAEYCRDRITKMGLKIFPKSQDYCSPTVTAIYVPEGWIWEDFNAKLRSHGIFIGGSYGKLAGKVFRIGHMGIQADMEYVKCALDVLELILEKNNVYHRID